MKFLILSAVLATSMTAWGKKTRRMQEGDLNISDCISRVRQSTALARLKNLEVPVKTDAKKIAKACDKIEKNYKGMSIRRAIGPGDLNVNDCADKTTRARARERLHDSGVNVGYTSSAVQRACQQLQVQMTTKSNTAPSTTTINDKLLDQRVEDFSDTIENDIRICSSYTRLRNVAKQTRLSYRTATMICTKLRRDLLKTLHPSDTPGFADELFLGDQLDGILERTDIRRNPNITGLRIRFDRAYKPGIDDREEAPHPAEFLDRGVWNCIENPPFKDGHAGMSGAPPSARIPLKFFIDGKRIEDDHFFVYDYSNGVELSAASPNARVFRSLRLEYVCEPYVDGQGLQ